MKKLFILLCIMSFLSCSNQCDIKGTWVSVTEDSITKFTRVQTFFEDNIWESKDTFVIFGPKSTQSLPISSYGSWEQKDDLISINISSVSTKGNNYLSSGDESKQSFKITNYSANTIECYDIRDPKKTIVLLNRLNRK